MSSWSEESKEKRKEFADALDKLAEMAKDVPSGGWDVPINYIRGELKKWANDYRRN